LSLFFTQRTISAGLAGEVLADVAGADPAALSPVGVPVGAMRAAGAAALAAPNGLEAVPDLARATANDLVGAEREVAALDEKPTDEDQEAPEIVLVEGADLPDEPAVEAQGCARRAATAPWTPLRSRPPG